MAQLWEENIQENGKGVWLSQSLFLSLNILSNTKNKNNEE